MTGEGVEVSPQTLADLERLGKALKGAEKVVQKHLRAGLRAAVKPATEAVIREGAQSLPARGGLRARVAAGRGGLRADVFGGRSVRLTLVFTDKKHDSLAGLDAGQIRHPVYGRWVKGIRTQSIPAHRFSEAFLRQAPSVRIRTQAALEATAAELARKA